MAETKHKPDFVVRLTGEGVRPWQVPMRALARVLDATQRLVDQREDETNEENAKAVVGPVGEALGSESKTLRLLTIRDGSAVYAMSAPFGDLALKSIADAGKAITNPEKSDWSEATLSAIREFSDVAKSLHCDVEIRRAGKGRQFGDVLAVITPTTYSKIASSAFVTGDTSIFGRVERVGGATEMHCAMRLPRHHRLVICRVIGADLVRELGRFLYQDVMVNGQAVWLRHNWQIRSFTINSFEPPKTGSIQNALKRIHDAGGRAWDKIPDPDKAIAEMRGA